MFLKNSTETRLADVERSLQSLLQREADLKSEHGVVIEPVVNFFSTIPTTLRR